MSIFFYGRKIENKAEIDVLDSLYQGIMREEADKIHFNFFETISPAVTKFGYNNIVNKIPYYMTDVIQKEMDIADIRTLSVANMLGSMYLLNKDRIIDNQRGYFRGVRIPNLVFFLSVVFYRAIREYEKVFPANHEFWVFYEKYINEFIQSSVDEKENHEGRISAYDENNLLSLGRKFSPVKFVCAGLCLFDGRNDLIRYFSDIIDYFHTGFQLFDDIRDWEEDLANSNYTFFLTTIFEELALNENSIADSGSDSVAQKIKQHLVSSDIVNRFVQKSNKFYSDAVSISDSIHCPQLSQYIKQIGFSYNSMLIEKFKKDAVAI